MGRQNKRGCHQPIIVSLVGVTLFAGAPALAQVATSTDTVLPPVEVVGTSEDEAAKPKRNTAPKAAQQKSVPRARAAKRQPKPVQAPEAAPPPATTTSVATEPSGEISDEAVVSATGSATPVDQVGSSVTVVTSQEIAARQYRSVPDVLRTVPGLNVVQTGGPGGQTSVFIRGTNSNHVKVIVDGIDVTDPSTTRTYDIGLLATDDIERIEVLRGPQSGLYGADALGGVIVVHTKKGDGPPKVTAMAEGGSFGTFNKSAGVRGSEGRFNYALNVSHQRSSDIPVTPRELLMPGARRFDNDFENLTLSGKFGVAVTKDFDVNVVTRYVNSTLDITDSLFVPLQRTSESEQFFSRAEGVWRTFGGLATHVFGFNYTDIKADQRDPGRYVGFSDGQRLEYDWRSAFTLAPGYVLTVGGDYQIERAQVSSSSIRSAEEDNIAGYAQLQMTPFKNASLVGNVRHDENENFGGYTTWRVAGSYLFEQTDTRFNSSVGTGFKAPTLNDRFAFFPGFGGFPDFVGNPDLQPEEVLGWDVGFEQGLFDGRMRFGATYFNNDITNLIDGFSFDPVRNAFTTVNFGSVRTEGVEVFASADITDDLRVRLDYTLTETKNEDTGAELLRRPRHKASATIGWTPIDPLLITTTILYVGEQDDIHRATFGTIRMPDYTLVNVAAEYRVDDNMAVFGRVENLFDKDYQNPHGFEGLGFGVFGGVKFTN